MIIVNVIFKAIEVSKYTRTDLTLKIHFDDGSKERVIEKQTNLENVEELTNQVFNEVRRIQKELTSGNTGDFLDDVVIVRFEDDERVKEKMLNAFRRIKDEMRKLKTADLADNYLQNISMFQKLRISL